MNKLIKKIVQSKLQRDLKESHYNLNHNYQSFKNDQLVQGDQTDQSG